MWDTELCFVEIKMIFLFQVRMMDVETCGTQDINLKKQNGKLISSDREVEGKGNKKSK